VTNTYEFGILRVGGLLVAAAALSAAFSGSIRSTASASAGPHVAAPNAAAVNALGADKGRFRILVNGQQVGQEEFEIVAQNGDWIARGATDIQSAQGNTHVTGALDLRADGTPANYQWSTQGPKKASAAVAFNNAVATIELHLGNARPYTQQFTFPTARIAVLDDNLYDQYAVLARLYDWTKKGSQAFSVLVPQELTPGTVTVDSLGKQDWGGRQLEELRVKAEDNEINLYLDGLRVVGIVVPSANVEIVRE
jgi:hypothetical protein